MQNFDGHVGRHLVKTNLYKFSNSWKKIDLNNSYPAYLDKFSDSSMKIGHFMQYVIIQKRLG